MQSNQEDPIILCQKNWGGGSKNRQTLKKGCELLFIIKDAHQVMTANRARISIAK